MNHKARFNTVTNNYLRVIAVIFVLLPIADIALAGPYGSGLYGSGVYEGGEVCDPPYPPGDITEDCRIDLDDLAFFVLDWLRCNHPADSNCEQTWLY